MELNEINLGDIPDLSDIGEESRPDPFTDGWYEGVILGKREFTDQNGNDRVFESSDAASQRGDSRNVRLQVELKRQSDGRTLNVSTMINYRPEDVSAETIQAVTAHKAKIKDGEEWGPLFRSYMVLNRLGTLQRIAGVRQLQRTSEGGLDLAALYGKTAYFKIGPDTRNPAYKEVKTFSDQAPKGKKAFLL